MFIDKCDGKNKTCIKKIFSAMMGTKTKTDKKKTKVKINFFRIKKCNFKLFFNVYEIKK
jgi:hypothetical protein